jgi:hypothetical protein
MYDGVEVLARIVLRQRDVQLTVAVAGSLLGLVVLVVARRHGWSRGRRALGVLAAFALAVLPAVTLARGSGWHPLSWPWQRGGCGLAPQLTRITPEVLLNTAVLAPFGLLAVLALRSVWWVLGVAVVAVLAVELIHAMTGWGRCEASDLVHNLLGAAVGAGLAAAILRGQDRHLPG